MNRPPRNAAPTGPDLPRLMAYIADLELEVDRLRRHNHLLHQEAWAALDRIQGLWEESPAPADGPPPLGEVVEAVRRLGGVLADLRETPGYHPAHDQVTPIAFRPLAEQVFRWQQRLLGVPSATLRLELESDYIEWFPARLRHVLDNLISNALKYRDPEQDEAWVGLRLRVAEGGYELRVSDNGVGLPAGGTDQVFELYHRSAPARAAGLGVGLPVVKMLVEQSGGSLRVDQAGDAGTTFVVLLPRFDVNDYLL